MSEHQQGHALITPGVLLGIGLGGFFDGILFHQLLQVHSMLSARVPRDTVIGLEINMFWDGLFHAFTWTVTILGLAMLWRVVQSRTCELSTRIFVGSLAVGWGLFNLVEGIIDHHILHIHHVTESENHLLWDILFLASGVGLIVLGCALIVSGSKWLLMNNNSGVVR